MKYREFHEAFYPFCKKNFTYDEPCVFNKGNEHSIRPTRENIDRLILIPAGFSAEDRKNYLEVDLSVLTKDLLSNFRKGKFIREYIKNVYSDDRAPIITSNYFKKYIPRVINDSDREELLISLFRGMKMYDLESRRSIERMTSNELFFDVLAALLICAITGQTKTLNDITTKISTADVLVDSILEHLKQGKKPDAYINDSIDKIFENYWEHIRYMFNPFLSNKKAREENEKQLISHTDLFSLIKELVLTYYIFDDTRQIEIYCLANVAYYQQIFLLTSNREYNEILNIISDINLFNITIKSMSASINPPRCHQTSSLNSATPKNINMSNQTPSSLNQEDRKECTDYVSTDILDTIRVRYEEIIDTFNRQQEADRYFRIVADILDNIFGILNPQEYIQKLPGRKLSSEDQEHIAEKLKDALDKKGYNDIDPKLDRKEKAKKIAEIISEIATEHGDKFPF